MDRRDRPVFLATTAREDFWDTSRKTLYLHEGCCRFGRRHVWQLGVYEIFRSSLEDWEAYYRAVAEARSSYELILDRLVSRLNLVHGVNYTKRYWRIVIGFWLMHYVETMYVNYLTIQEVLSRYSDLETLVLARESFVTHLDSPAFFNAVLTDTYNLQLITRILESLGKAFPSRASQANDPSEIHGLGNSWPKRIMTGLTAAMGRRAKVLVRTPCFPKRAQEVSFIFRTGGKVCCDFLPQPKGPEVGLDLGKREKLFIKDAGNAFEQMVFQSLSMDVPKIFVENYVWGCEQADKMYGRFRPNAIVAASAFCFDDIFKLWSASQTEKGCRICSIQQGTIYGLARSWPLEEYEMSLSDQFYSWGWAKGRGTAKVKAMPATKFVGVAPIGPDNSQEGVLLTTNCFPRYFYRFQDFRHYDNEEYFRWQVRFMEDLPSEIAKLTRVRLFVTDYGCDIRERWQALAPDVRLEGWDVKFRDSLRNCRLHVTDHMASTFVDGFIADKPTLLFWNPLQFQPRPEARPYFDALRRSGILFDTPQRAAEEVGRIYADVTRWWRDPARQSAVMEFCRHFALTSPDAENEWLKEFQLLGRV